MTHDTPAQALSISTQILDEKTVQTVNARNLHAFLGVRKDFSTWVKDRIKLHGFVENQDFVCSPILGSKDQSPGRGGHNRLDYHFTVDTAKHIAMAEHTPKGKEAREYFIECERQLYAIPGINVSTKDQVERLRLPNLLHGFPKGTTMPRLIREDRQLVGQGVHNFGLTPEVARERAIALMADRYGSNPAFLFRGLPVIVPERKKRRKKMNDLAQKDSYSTDPVTNVSLVPSAILPFVSPLVGQELPSTAALQAANALQAAASTGTSLQGATLPSAGLPNTGQLGQTSPCAPVFCGAQELAGLIPVVCFTGQPDGHSVNEALIVLQFAQRRDDNSVYPRLPQADGMFQMMPVPALHDKFFTVWDKNRLLPVLRQYFATPTRQLRLVKNGIPINPEQITLM